MSIGGASAWGIRSLADTFLRYYQPGLPVYLRYQQSPVLTVSGANYQQLGFMPVVTGGPSGITDVQINPQPDVKEVSLHNIGIMGARLNFGARTFLISDTFVQQQMNLLGYTDPYQVWRDPLVMGLYYNHRLFTIESITHEEVGQATTLWNLICNSSEFTSPSS